MKLFTITTFLLIVIYTKTILSINIYKEDFLNSNDINLDHLEEECSETSKRNCNKNRQSVEIANDYWWKLLNKRWPGDAYTSGSNSVSTSSPSPGSCLCGMESKLLDLGQHYYPRYLHTGICRAKGCGGLYRCVEKLYKVRVLKLRDTENTDSNGLIESIVLPKELKDIWQSQVFSVTVACECTT